MKQTFILFLFVYLLAASIAFADEYTFNYKYENQKFQIKQEASDQLNASSLASKKCFQKLTNGKYPGEEKGLEIIDVCANPNSTLQSEWYK